MLVVAVAIPAIERPTHCNTMITIYLDITVNPPRYICGHEWNSLPPISDCGDAEYRHDTEPRSVAKVVIWHYPSLFGERVSIECSGLSFMDADGSNLRPDPVACDQWRRIALDGVRSELAYLEWLKDADLNTVPFSTHDTCTPFIIVKR